MAAKVPRSPVLFTPGIDVSHHQGEVNWDRVAAHGAAFAFAKATEGVTLLDAQFAANWSGIKSAGMIRGAYHFFRPADSAVEQAEKFLQAVGSLEGGDLPPALDLEQTARRDAGQWKGIPPEGRVSVILSWLEEVEKKLGRKPLIYTRTGFVRSRLGDPGRLANYRLWIAHYTSAATPTVPRGWANWTFWQNSDSAEVGGMGGPVDHDWFNGSRDDLKALSQAVT